MQAVYDISWITSHNMILSITFFHSFGDLYAVNPNFRTTHLSGFRIQKMVRKRDADEKKTKDIDLKI